MEHKQKKFLSSKIFTWSPFQRQANQKFNQLKETQLKTLPDKFFQKNTLKYLQIIKQKQIYKLLNTIPKGVLHHLHSDCNQDLDFIKKYVYGFPGIYVDKQFKSWKYGSKQQAQKQGWITLQQIRKRYQSDDEFNRDILKMTQFTVQQIEQFSYKPTAWPFFQKKIQAFFAIFFQQTLYKNYLYCYLQAFIKNGYTRVQVRSPLFPLKTFDAVTSSINELQLKHFVKVSQQVQKQLKQKYPFFSLGIIFFGLKVFSPEVLYDYLKNIYEIQTHLTVGIDMVQQQDKFPQFDYYQKIFVKLRQEYKDKRQIVGAFHAGETQNKQNLNVIKVAKFGSKRIGHATNLFHHAYLADYIKSQNICLQICPLSNQILGYVYDLTQHPAIIYYHLGLPISISPDDPARFGYNGTTPDYYIITHGFHFDLKDLKLIALYSIQHALCTQEQRKKILDYFTQEWNQWIKKFWQTYA